MPDSDDVAPQPCNTDAACAGQDDETGPKRVRVPIRLGDGIFRRDEYADVDESNVAQWDARLWHDAPP